MNGQEESTPMMEAMRSSTIVEMLGREMGWKGRSNKNHRAKKKKEKKEEKKKLFEGVLTVLIIDI